ncbi:hypothetical protein U5801_08275 [Lamprobacter modestohalophilus]|uniref:hypothetical protein n=1 Tax=Lamprobacter modestohalophilus TaxID=1064514 RepID=UPI002ADEF1A0|nr:hypothetical protein [Lamprobacter modestohalophilus]MEA1049802.1 hypothetical protein [Lamprobacter modestohalophilus]
MTTAAFRPPPGGLALLLLPLLLLGLHYGYEAWIADACLDRGGAFDYETWTCSISAQVEAARPYLHRHWGKATIALSFSLSGLIVLLLSWLRHRRS